jgi:hypothetical protein
MYCSFQITQLKIDNNPFAKGFRENSDRSYENSILIQSNYNQDLIQPQKLIHNNQTFQSPYASQHNHHQPQAYQYYQYANANQQASNLYTSTPKMVSNTISYQMNHSPPTAAATMNQYYQQSMQSTSKKRSREESNEGENDLIESSKAKQSCDQLYYNSSSCYGSQIVSGIKNFGSSSSLSSSPSTSPSTANSLSNGVLSNSSPLSSFQY